MKYKRKSDPPESGAPRWMTTYSDMMTLILCFFILLYGISQVDLQKFKAMTESFQNRSIFEFYPSAIELETSGSGSGSGDLNGVIDKAGGEGQSDASKDDGENNGSLNILLSEITKFIDESGMEEIVVATRTERGVVLILPEQVLFNTGEAVILDSATSFLDRVGGLLKNVPNIVKVEGHTDSRPIQNIKYPSNWELSSARASSVIRYFTEKHGLDSKRFIATGYGDTRPVAPNNGPENWAKNRRVEIVIMEPGNENEEAS